MSDVSPRFLPVVFGLVEQGKITAICQGEDQEFIWAERSDRNIED